MELAALIISIISIAITVVFAIVQIINDKRLNDINLEAELSKEIFKEYLTLKFPDAISKISFEGNKLSNIVDLQNELNSLRSSIKFFKYCDEKFFNEFKTKSQELEDYIVSNEGKIFRFEEQGTVTQTIIEKMSAIYGLIGQKYKNG